MTTILSVRPWANRPVNLRRLAGRPMVALLVLLLNLSLALPASATPPPKRPHPHRKPWPITLTVQTVPRVPGMRIRFDDQTELTDQHGKVTFTQEHNFSPHTLKLLDTTKTYSNRRLEFARWAGQRDPDQAFRSSVTELPMRQSYTVTAAFAVQRPITIGLTTTQKTALDPGRVTSVTLRSGRDGIVKVPSSGQLWLDSLVPVYRNSAIALEEETYSLSSVMVDGTNTVDAGRQKFTPNDTTKPVFTTKFFTLKVTAHDLLFKGKSGESARIIFPNGSVHTLPLGPAGMVVIPGLPRGDYEVTVLGGGTGLPNELVLSRDTALDLPLATHLDYGALGLALAVLMAGLLLAGRGRRRALSAVRRLRRKTRHGRASGAGQEQTEPERSFEPA